MLLLFFVLLLSYEYLTNRWKRENSQHTVRKLWNWNENKRAEDQNRKYLRTDASDFNELNPTRLRISIKLNTVSAHKICRQRYRAMGDTLLCCIVIVMFRLTFCVLSLDILSLFLSLSFVICLHPNQKNW